MTASILRWTRVYSWLVALLMILPLVVVLVSSFTADSYIALPPAHWGTRWFGLAIHDATFQPALIFSFETSVVVMCISTIVGVTCAYGIERFRFPGRTTIHALVLAPFFIPHVVIAIGLVELFSTYKIATAPYGLVAGQSLIALPFVIRLAMVGIAGIDRRLEYAAQTLGASRWHMWRRISLPLAGPSVVAGALMAFLIAFDESVISIFTAAPGKTTLPVAIFNYVEQESDPRVSAISSIMIVFAVACILILEKSFGLLRILSGGQLRGADRGE